MTKIFLKWFLSASALLLLAWLDQGIIINGFGSALLASFVIGLLNLIVRPILFILTLPVTILTLGLFLFVINAFVFLMASSFLEGFQVIGFGNALVGSILYSVLGIIIDSALERLFPPRRLQAP
jgi:putative membrane protein